MKTEILKILRDSDGYTSGQQLCDQFQVSRTAVWKAIQKLESEGYEIEAVRNKGYRLKSTPDILNENEIKSRIQTKWVGQNVKYYDVTDSTNVQAKNLAEEGAPEGTLAVADRQKAGRGRRGRAWESPSGSSIYMSLLLRPQIAPNRASMLTLVMALAVAEGIEKTVQKETQIKWPNDIIMNGKKVCGILTEMNAEVDYIHHVVIGVGINVNMNQFPKELDMATSLRIEWGEIVQRSVLIANVMEAFEFYYERFMETENLSGLMEEYNQKLVNLGREVTVLGAKETFGGKAMGINDQGELLVKKEDGTVASIYAGEVSVRGVYGYV